MNSVERHLESASMLSDFAEALGWDGLRSFSKIFNDTGQVVVWHEAGDANYSRTHCALQINHYPLRSVDTFSAAVYGIRYRICSGWHAFACRDSCEARLEAQRLHPWLHREWFQSAERRRAYRLAHRECVGYTWKRLRDFGEPHYPDGVK